VGGVAVRSLEGLDVKISAYSPELASFHYGSKAHPARGGFMVSGFFGGARRRGERPVFVLEGPDAEEAARKVRAVIDAHPSELPGGSFGTAREAIRQQFRGELERRGVLEDYDRLRAESVDRRKARAETLARDSPYGRATDGLERWRAVEEQMKAMNERGEAWTYMPRSTS
jgi:hypothetical protein